MIVNWVAEFFDTVVSVAGKYARWLNIKGRRICFLIWAICSVYWVGRDIAVGLYSQAAFAVFSVGLNAYGFFNWKKNKIGN